MTDNDRLKAWQDNGSTPNRPSPDYLNDDAAAMSLLDTLVERGWEYSLFGNQNRMNKVDFRIYKGDVGVSMAIKPTINEAITAACLEVARKE